MSRSRVADASITLEGNGGEKMPAAQASCDVFLAAVIRLLRARKEQFKH